MAEIVPEMEKVEVRIRKPGIKSGLLAFFLGPPLGGAACGLVLAAGFIIASAVGSSPEPPTIAQILFAPFLWPIAMAIWSFSVAAAPAAVAATYVSIRVGITGRLTWVETVILSIICLAFVPTERGISPFDFLSRHWEEGLILISCSLFSALLLRYLAGRWGLVR